MLRTGLCLTVCLALLAGALPALAQDYENIYLANGLVARLRDPGQFSSISERAARVEQALVEVLSTQDTMNPNVQVKQEAGTWAVYSGPIRVLTVLPRDASANNLQPRQLAAIWAQNLKERLPLATPVPRMGAAAPTAAPRPTTPAATAPPTTPAPRPQPPATTGTPIAQAPTAPATPPAAAPVASPMTQAAALALLLDSFNTARGLPEDEYLVRREALAAELMVKLRPFLGGPAAPSLPTPVTTPRPTPGALITPPTTPATTAPAALPSGRRVPAEWASLPVKQRVDKKFELGARVYQEMRRLDPERAEYAGNLFAEARTAKAAYRFEEAEGFLDGALALMGYELGR